jgi:hypothetical protein
MESKHAFSSASCAIFGFLGLLSVLQQHLARASCLDTLRRSRLCVSLSDEVAARRTLFCCDESSADDRCDAGERADTTHQEHPDAVDPADELSHGLWRLDPVHRKSPVSSESPILSLEMASSLRIGLSYLNCKAWQIKATFYKLLLAIGRCRQSRSGYRLVSSALM